MAYWIIVANSSEACIYSADSITLSSHFLQLIKKLSHEDSKKKIHDLVSDHAGKYNPHSSGHGAYSEHTDPKDVEKDKFAKELAAELERGRGQNSYARLILVMPSHFYGLLEKHTSKKIQNLVEKVIQKDYLLLSEKDLEDVLRPDR